MKNNNIIIKNFGLGAILSIITGICLVDDYETLMELVWFVCDDYLIGPIGLSKVKDKVKSHLLSIHPELKGVKYKRGEETADEYVSKMEKRFGKFLTVTKADIELPKENSTQIISSITSDDILLSREELDFIESNQIFNWWLNGLVNENDLTEEEKKIIYAYQLHYDLTLSDDFIYNSLDYFRCYGIKDLLNNDEIIESISMIHNIPVENIRIKALLMFKRQEKEKLKVKKLTKDKK